MSLINIEDDQRWVPTHVQVTVLRGRGLRAKGKHGTSDVYTVIQVGKEKFTTAVFEKTTAPEWSEECAFELLPGVLEAGGRGAYPPGSSDLAFTVMHRALIGPDVFLGHVVLPLDKVFQDRICLRNEWYKLRSKSGRKEKERGELQVTVQFTRNNLTASMFDLSVKDKPRSAFGKLKDRMAGKKRGDAESASAIVPGGYAILSGGGRRISGEEVTDDDDEGRRSKVKSFFLKGRLRRSSDVQSSTSLASECSGASSPGGSLSPTAGVNMLVSDLSNSPSEDSNHPADSSPVQSVQAPPKPMTHKRAFSDEVSRITVALPRPRAVETLRAQNEPLSRSSLCINGIHVYGAEPLGPGPSTLPATLGLLQKCAPLSRSLQNLARRAEDPRRSPGTARRWSFDRAGKEEKVPPATAQAESSGQPSEATMGTVATVTVKPDSASEGKKQKKNLFSHGRSETAGKGSDTPKAEQGQAPHLPEERYKGWFSAKDSQNKPSQEVSPMVETSTDAPCHPSLCSPNHLLPCPSPASASPGSGHNANPFTPSPATPPISPSNPFLTRLQCNPFYEELLADQAVKCSLPTPPRPSSSPLWLSTAAPSRPNAPATTLNAVPQKPFVPQRERPRGVSRQRSLPALLSRTSNSSPNPFTTRSLSESGCEWDESFEAFATSRLKSPRGPSHRRNGGIKEWPVDGIAEETVANESSAPSGKVPPLPPRWPVRTPVKECRSDSWLDRAQELAVKKEACLLSQTDAASMLHRKEGERKRNTPCSFQDLSEEKGKMTEPLMKPSNSDPSSGHVRECPVKSFSRKSSALQHAGLTVSGCDLEGLSRNHRFQQGHTSVEQGPNNETNLSSTPEFFALEVPEVLDEEGFTSNTFIEVEDKLPSLLSEIYRNKSETDETDSTATIPTHRVCTANQKSHVTSANTLEPVPNITTVHPITTSTKIMDSEVNMHIPNKHVCDSQLASTNSALSCDARIDNVFEINNNTDKDFGLSLSVPRLLPDKVHLNKCHSLTSNTFRNPATMVSVDYGDAISCMPISPGPNVGSTFGITRNAAEVLDMESDFNISTEPVEASSSEVRHPLGTSVEASIYGHFSSLTGAQTNNTHFGNTDTGNANIRVIGKECSQTELPPGNQKTVSVMPGKALAAEVGLGNTIEQSTIVLDAQSGDSHLGNMFQGNLMEEHDNSNLKTSHKASANHLYCNSPLISHYLETNEPRTVREQGALISCSPAEDKTIGETTENEHVLHPVKNTSEVSMFSDTEAKDGPLFKATCSQNVPSLIGLLQQDECEKQESSEPPAKPPRLYESTTVGEHVNEESKERQEPVHCRKYGYVEPVVLEYPLSKNTQKISFEDLHAKVAPSSRSQTQPRLPLHGSAPWASSAPYPAAKSNAQSALLPLPVLIPPTVRPTAGTAQATATPSSTAPPVIGSAHTVLPKETCRATSSLSHQESSPHPVKPLTTSALQGEKKPEGRSVLVSGLEKFKSTMKPGRVSQTVEPEDDSTKSLSERAAQYDHLTNNEIIALLLQREAELEKKGAEMAKQGALLEKREVEIKKMKVQVRDLEDYIDRLLVRIMEQTPTILQVRSRYK